MSLSYRIGVRYVVEDENMKCELKDCYYYDESTTYNCSRREFPDVENCENRKVMNVKGIVIQFLKQHGYDGLFFSEADCSCVIDDLCHAVRM